MDTEKAEQLKAEIKQFEAEYAELQKKHNLKVKISVKFPQYNILPDVVTLALNVLNKEGMQFGFVYEYIENKEGSHANL